MRSSGSLLLIAVGTILRFAVDANNRHADGFNIGTAGVILMIVGAVGLVLSAISLSVRRRTDVITHGRRGRAEPRTSSRTTPSTARTENAGITGFRAVP